MVQECIYRDGSYWLTPEMYVDNQYFLDLESMWTQTLVELEKPRLGSQNTVSFTSEKPLEVPNGLSLIHI